MKCKKNKLNKNCYCWLSRVHSVFHEKGWKTPVVNVNWARGKPARAPPTTTTATVNKRILNYDLKSTVESEEEPKREKGAEEGK